MEKIEENIVNSFRLAKSDIIQLQNEFLELSQTQERIMEMLDMMKDREIALGQHIKDLKQGLQQKNKTKTVVRNVVKKVRVGARKTVSYVASKSGNKFHIVKCPFAQNIKPKSKVKFKSKTKALNDGFKPCNCVK